MSETKLGAILKHMIDDPGFKAVMSAPDLDEMTAWAKETAKYADDNPLWFKNGAPEHDIVMVNRARSYLHLMEENARLREALKDIESHQKGAE